jgi:hypothetical protein
MSAILNVPLVRRSLGILIGFAPAWLAIVSVAFRPRRPSILSLIALGIAALLAAFNFYVAFVRPWLFRLRHSNTDDLQHVSGIPAVASIIIVHVIIWNLGSRVIAVAALIILVIDVYGLPWTLVAIWKDRAFWEEPV